MEALTGPEEAVGEEGSKPSVKNLAANFCNVSILIVIFFLSIRINENCTVAV
jgi:hypothetical protein